MHIKKIKSAYTFFSNSHKGLVIVGVCMLMLMSFVWFSRNSNTLKLVSLADAAPLSCGDPSIFFHAQDFHSSAYWNTYMTCSIVAEFDSNDVGTASFASSPCTGPWLSNIGDFYYTCQEQIDDDNPNPTYSYGYAMQQRACQDVPHSLSCYACTYTLVGLTSCGDLGGSSGSVPTVDLVANPASVSSGGSSTLTWTVSNATSCSASASPASVTWSGNKSSSGGTQSTGAITANTTYTLTCTNGTSNASDSATVTVGGAVVNFDLLGGVTSPYTQSVTGNNPVNGVDARFNLNITSGCAASCSFDSFGNNICNYQCSRLDYQLRCNPTDIWSTLYTRYDPANGVNYNRTFTNRCNYTTDSQMQGRVVITKTSPTNSVATYEDSVPITVTTPPAATCTPSTQTVEAGQSVTVIGSPGGEAPVSCSYTGGGFPASSSSCSPFTTTYNTTGTKTITFTVNAANGTANCQSTVNVVNATSPNATVDVTAGTTTPYANFVLAESSVNNVDVSLAGNITSDCGTSGDPNANKCSARYRVDCTRDGTWEGDFTYSNVSNETKGYLFDNICSYFGPNTYYIRGEMKITKNSDPASSVTVLEDVPVYVTSPETPAGASCTPTSATVETNQSVTINGNVTGTSPSCSWSGGGTPGTSSSCAPFTTTYTTSGTKTINLSVTAGGTTANCSSSITVNDPIILPLSYTLTAIRNGQGTITSDVAGINCGSMCMGVYDEGTAVVLTATPAPRWRFIEWLGDCTAAGNTCTVQVDGPRTVTAKFRPNTFYEEF